MTPSPSPDARPAKRPRVLVACQRCKTRRQKCDNGSPACHNCTRSGARCQYSDRTAYPPAYVKTLEDKVKHLEATLKSQAGVQSPTTPAEETAESSSGLVTGMGLLSSCAAAEPHYFGFSAGLSLAHFVQVAIDFGSTSSDVVSLPLLTDRPFSNQALNPDTTPASFPSRRTGAAYIRAYLLLIHPLYPFLDRLLLWRAHKSRTSTATAASSPESQMDEVMLHLVYAIGSRCLQLLGNHKITKNTPEGHFLRAMQIIGDGLLKFTSIRSIELTLLLAIHSMRSPSGTSVWHLSGLTIRQCIELGLHKQRAINAQSANVVRADQHKKRLFWSVYIFERKTALVLGRPFALSDEEIDLQLPFPLPPPLPLPVAQSDAADNEGEDVSFHRAHVELYQLHTQIRLALYQIKRAAQNKEQLKATISSLFDQLDAWKAGVQRTFDDSAERSTQHKPDSSDSSDSDMPTSNSSGSSALHNGLSRSVEIERTELLLEYYKARRSLLQPLMTEGRAVYPSFDAADYMACADASGQICQLYRRLHRLSPIPFSLRDLHAIFVAGFTLIYAICSAPAIYSPRRARDIGACSTLLYVITEQWSSAKKYRDAFEVVAEKMEESALRYRQGGEAYAEPGFLAGVAGRQQALSPPVTRTEQHASTMAFGAVATPAETVHASPGGGLAAGIELDLESDIYGIEGLLYNEGLDWFTEAVL
ncbi:zinc c6 transcription factor [Ophiostoma piceae UAMH 11346]|uniref:Zinc c6 transcription factor n=1 Tax=Ophiostoma piceae (strain UAMH 11346) TaxID=1262450 RepID=S3BY59_OPHP1|nr:zinc c6 transcription factor [Ophiostoma piceae UAMH 11346]